MKNYQFVFGQEEMSILWSLTDKKLQTIRFNDEPSSFESYGAMGLLIDDCWYIIYTKIVPTDFVLGDQLEDFVTLHIEKCENEEGVNALFATSTSVSNLQIDSLIKNVTVVKVDVVICNPDKNPRRGVYNKALIIQLDDKCLCIHLGWCLDEVISLYEGNDPTKYIEKEEQDIWEYDDQTCIIKYLYEPLNEAKI